MMVLYYLFRAFAAFISVLPFPLLYIVSDLLYIKLYYVFRYRRKVVNTNLRNSFPEKSPKEIRHIARRYYRHLSDVILEVIKLSHMSGEELLRRVHFKDLSIIEEMLARKKSIIATIGHLGNWEWMPIALQFILPVKGYAVVKPLSDPFFEQYMTRIRTRLLIISEVVPFKQIFRTLVKGRNEISLTILAADQTPHRDEINHWCNFLNQDTAFFLGAEKMAVSLKSAVIFMNVQQSRRGHYDVSVVKITDEPGQMPPLQIIRNYVSLLEDAIRENPYNWLWSHRRWKYNREERGEWREENGEIMEGSMGFK